MTTDSSGLVRTIGRWSLVALMINSIIGAGIFGLPSLLAASLGGYSPVSSIVAGAGVLVLAACIAEVASRFEETGGLYLYARVAFGRFMGLVIGWLTWLTRIAAPAAAGNLFVTYSGQFYPALRGRSAQLAVLAGLVGHLAILNYIGVRMGKAVSNFFTIIKVGFLGLFILGGLAALALHPEVRVPLVWGATTSKGWFEAFLLLVFAYGGFEGALIVGGESRNPKKDMPFALLTALAMQCFIYTGVLYVVVATLPAAGNSARPLADAAQRFAGSWGATAIAIAALISTYGYLSANLLHAPRIAFALAEQGDFPALLAKIHSRYRTPYVSIGLYALLLFGFSALGTFQWNAILSAVSRLVIYGAMAVAVPVLRKRAGPAPFSLPFAGLFWGLGLILTLVLLTQMGRSEFLVVGFTMLVAALNWVAVRRVT